MNWLPFLGVFAISLMIGGYLSRLLERGRPTWSVRRRQWAAALVVPGFIVVATIVGIGLTLAIGPGEGENMQDLAVAALLAMGAVFASIALAGGWLGASFAVAQDPK